MAVGPLHVTAPVCLSCIRPLPSSSSSTQIHRCPLCRMPFCSPSCAGDAAHAAAECPVLSKGGGGRLPGDSVTDFGPGARPHPVYQCIMPLRCLVLREERPEGWRAMQVRKA